MHKAKMILNEVPTMLKSLKNIFNIINGNKDYYNPKIDMKKEDDNLNGKKLSFRVFYNLWWLRKESLLLNISQQNMK